MIPRWVDVGDSYLQLFSEVDCVSGQCADLVSIGQQFMTNIQIIIISGLYARARLSNKKAVFRYYVIQIAIATGDVKGRVL